MGLYEDLIAASVYTPTLTGGTKPRTWNNAAQDFNGTSDRIVAPSGSTLGLSNTTWISAWVVPDAVVSTYCICEFSGLSHGVTLWIINGTYWASVHRSDATIATASAVGVASVGVAAHLFVQVTSAGLSLYVDGVLAGSQSVAINTSNAVDSGGVGAVYSDSRLPGGGAVDNAPTASSNYFDGVIADLYVGLTNQGSAGALAMFNGPATVPVKRHHYNQLMAA
jgi:hypothetical protein